MRVMFNAIQLRPRMAGVRTLAAGLLQGIQDAAGNTRADLELIVVTTSEGRIAFEQAGVDFENFCNKHKLVVLPAWCSQSGLALLVTVVVLPVISAWFRASVILSYDYMSPLFSTAKRLTVVTDLRLQEFRKIKAQPFPVFVRSLCNFANSRFADSVVAISEHSAAEFEAVYGSKSDLVTAIPLGVHAKNRQEHAPVPGRIVTIGTTHRHKRFDTLIEAAGLVKQQGYKFQINHFGFDGDQEEALKQLVSANELDNEFRFNGHVSADALERAQQGAHVFVATSEYEGFGLTPAEAASHGASVVASDIPAHRAAVPHADFFPVEDSNALAHILIRHLLQGPRTDCPSPDVRDWTAVGQDYIDLVDSVMADKT